MRQGLSHPPLSLLHFLWPRSARFTPAPRSRTTGGWATPPLHTGLADYTALLKDRILAFPDFPYFPPVLPVPPCCFTFQTIFPMTAHKEEPFKRETLPPYTHTAPSLPSRSGLLYIPHPTTHSTLQALPQSHRLAITLVISMRKHYAEKVNSLNELRKAGNLRSVAFCVIDREYFAWHVEMT